MELISTDRAPAAVGPYSQAVKAGGLFFCSGQIGIDPGTGKLVGGGVESQVEQVLRNIRNVLESAGLGLKDVVKTTIFLADMDDFQIVNGCYAKAFGDHMPARSTVEVGRLPLAARVEIECVALESARSC